MALADLRNMDMQELKRRALQIRELASGLAARVRYSRTWWYSGAAVLLGLSLARFGHSVTLYMVSKSTPLPPPRQAVAQSNSSEQMFSDPTITVGGALFQRAGEGTTAANAAAVVEQPAKPFKLTATLEGSPEFARALIEVQGEGIREYCAASRACSKKEKDCECTVQNATIISIAQEHIWIKLNQNRYKLKIGQSTTDLAQQAAAAPATPGQPAVATSGGTVISKVISREEVNKNILGNPAKIYEGAQFGPHLVNGKIEGYKIARVNDDHVFAKLGAKSGDIIRKVNGYGLNDTERMLDLWKAIRTAPEVKIELERDGKVITYDFQIRN
ncbi:MAG: PDZ domain-containing protein [Turneriella sp.]